jgi:hypothetical protein
VQIGASAQVRPEFLFALPTRDDAIWDFLDIGHRRWMLMWAAVTEDSENPEQGYGPSLEGVEPTGQIAAQSADQPPAQRYVPTQRPTSGTPHAPGSAPLGARPYINGPADSDPSPPGTAPDAWPSAAAPDTFASLYAAAEPDEPTPSSVSGPASPDLYADAEPDVLPSARWRDLVAAAAAELDLRPASHADEAAGGESAEDVHAGPGAEASAEASATYLSPAAMAAMALPTSDKPQARRPYGPAGSGAAAEPASDRSRGRSGSAAQPTAGRPFRSSGAEAEAWAGAGAGAGAWAGAGAGEQSTDRPYGPSDAESPSFGPSDAAFTSGYAYGQGDTETEPPATNPYARPRPGGERPGTSRSGAQGGNSRRAQARYSGEQRGRRPDAQAGPRDERLAGGPNAPAGSGGDRSGADRSDAYAYFRPEVGADRATRYPFAPAASPIGPPTGQPADAGRRPEQAMSMGRANAAELPPPIEIDPQNNAWSSADSFGLPATGRRIEPSPPRRRSRLIPGILVGLLAGLLLFGSAGWFVGRTAAPTAQSARTPAPTAGPTLGVFEQSQVRVNRQDFAGTGLGPVAEGWLPYLSTCSRSGRRNGPALNRGEKVRVRCTLDGMSAIFVEYRSVADRDRARQRMLDSSVPELTAGIAPADKRPAPSGRTAGNYVEYAYRLTEAGATRTVSGIWWDDAKTPIAGYLLAFWQEGLGESWEPIRDLWSRYA